MALTYPGIPAGIAICSTFARYLFSMEEEIKKCLEVLARGGTILYPTDTIWGIGCDATNSKAVNNVYLLKQRTEQKSLIILLDDMSRLDAYVEVVPTIARDLLKHIDSPLTIIYPRAKNLAPNVMAEDHSIAIRIVKDTFCKTLIHDFGKPIVSTSANISGQNHPVTFKNISPILKKGVDHCVDESLDQIQEVKPSQIIKIDINGEFKIIRS